MDRSDPARPAPGTELCTVAEIADPGAKGFRFRAEAALFAGFLVRQGDAVAGYLDRCPHAGWPLSTLDDRYLTRDGRRILCSGHGALFAVETGECTAGPCLGERLAPWPIEVRDGRVFAA